MRLSRTIAISLLLALSSICLVRPTSAQETTESSLFFELLRYDLEREIARRLLGEGRWSVLEAARFEMDLYSKGFRPHWDQTDSGLEDVEDDLLHCATKFWQERLERRWRVEERRDLLRARFRQENAASAHHAGGIDEPRSKTGLDVSPRVRLGSHSWLGVRLRVSGSPSRFLSRTALYVNQSVDGQGLALQMTYGDRTTKAFVAFRSDHERLGRVAEVGVRVTLGAQVF